MLDQASNALKEKVGKTSAQEPTTNTDQIKQAEAVVKVFEEFKGLAIKEMAPAAKIFAENTIKLLMDDSQ